MKYTWRVVLVALLVLMGLLGAVPALADNAPAGTVETGLLWGEGINSGSSHNSFHAQGGDWVFYVDHNAGNTSLYDVVYEVSFDHGTTWTKYVVVSATDTVFRDLAVWYEPASGNVSYVRAATELAAFFVKYREGTPNANGTITWAVAEQYVDASAGNIANVAHCVDELGVPWAAWTENVGGNYTPMAECSSTTGGLWTERVGSHKEDFVNATAGNITCYYVSLTPVQWAPYPNVQLAWTEEGVAGPLDNLAGIQASFGNTTAWSPVETPVPVDLNGLNGTLIYLESAFTFYDPGGASLVGFYTDRGGNLTRISRTTVQQWGDQAKVTQLAPSAVPDSWWFPSLAGYQQQAGGEDLLLVLHDMYYVYYMKYHYLTSTWDGIPTAIWGVPAVGPGEIHVIMWANVQYKFGSAVGFPWMWGNISFIPNGPWPEGTLQYWWMDSAALAAGELQQGYYAHVGAEAGVIEGVQVGIGLISLIYVLVYAMAAIVLLLVLSMVGTGSLTVTIILAAIMIVLGTVGVQMILGVIASW